MHMTFSLHADKIFFGRPLDINVDVEHTQFLQLFKIAYLTSLCVSKVKEPEKKKNKWKNCNKSKENILYW